MDKLIITVPSWIVCIVGIWFTLTTIETGLSLYSWYLSWKLRKLIGANKEKEKWSDKTMDELKNEHLRTEYK